MPCRKLLKASLFIVISANFDRVSQKNVPAKTNKTNAANTTWGKRCKCALIKLSLTYQIRPGHFLGHPVVVKLTIL